MMQRFYRLSCVAAVLALSTQDRLVNAFAGYYGVPLVRTCAGSVKPPAVLPMSLRSSNEYDRPGLSLHEQVKRQSITQALLGLSEESSRLETVALVGWATLPAPNRDVPCLVLAERSIEVSSTLKEVAQPCMFVPVEDDAILKLLNAALSEAPLNKVSLLRLNTALVNRDGGAFDELPWSAWTIDPLQRNRDAAGNAIAAKFHLGKRDAYNRLMGRDWSSAQSSKSTALQQALTDLQEGQAAQMSDNDQAVLARRMTELQIREDEMDVAEWDYQIAVAKQSDPDSVNRCEDERAVAVERLADSRERLSALERSLRSSDDESEPQDASGLSELATRIVQATVDRPASPYPGALGYAPIAKRDQETFSYTSSYDMLRQIISDQLQAEVIGAVLENTSWITGTAVLGGALVLRRNVAKKSITAAGERLQLADEDEDFGNRGVQGGQTMLVECRVDEAIGMGLACNVPLQIESSLLDRASLIAKPVASSAQGRLLDTVPKWNATDPEISVLREGQAGNQSKTERVAPVRTSWGALSLFDRLFEPKSGSAARQRFPADNPIKTLDQFDEMSDEDKARTLMSMSNFDGVLPRPRVVRNMKRSGRGLNPLDSMILPLIDESVRRQYRVRDATRRGDMDLVRELEQGKSQRQIAKEKAAAARDAGADDVADWWENEVRLYDSLRADVTQDEGSYSRWLDRDEWYERDRRRHASKLDKTKFGTLLDGIE